MRPIEILIQERRRETEIPATFSGAYRGVEFGQVQRLNSDKTVDVLVANRPHPMTGIRPTRPGPLRPGDHVHVGHLHGSPDLPFIFAVGGAATGRAGQPRDANPPPPALVTAIWPTSQGNLRLDCLCEQSQTVPDLSDTGVPFITLDNPGLDPLGIVLFSYQEAAAIAVYYPALVGSAAYQNRLSAYSMGSLSKLWETNIGPTYSYPASFQDLALGLRQPWVAYDPQYQQFWLTGWGSSSARNTVYCLDTSGSHLGSSAMPFRLVQNTVGAGRFVKGWHSSRPPTGREGGDDALIRVFHAKNNQINSLWTLDPQTFLPSYQIATSSDGQTDVSPRNPRGRWPVIAAGRTMVFFVSGSKKLTNSNADRMIPLQYASGSWGAYQQPDDYYTADHACSIIGVNVDTGAIRWRRDWKFLPSHVIDTSSISAEESLRGATVGGTIGTLAPRPFYPSFGDTSWAPQLTYSGLAIQDTLTFSPAGDLSMPSCNPVETPPGSDNWEPNNITVTTPILPLIGVDWGGPDVWQAPSQIGTWTGPKYDYFAPGHPKLCPLPLEDMERGPIFEWPVDSQDFVRLEEVGGTLIVDSLSKSWHAMAVQGDPVCRGANRSLVQYQGQSQTEVPPSGGPPSNVCSSWVDRYTYWSVHMLPDIVHTIRLLLCHTGPNGETAAEDIDISQYLSRADSSILWPLKSNCYQIVPIPNVDRLVVVRDWHDTDSDRMEPYPVLEVRGYDDPSTLLERIPLLDNLDDYSYEYDPINDPGSYIARRRWDHYVDPTELMTGRGSGGDQFPQWIKWHHTVHNRETGDTEINQVLLQFEASGDHTITRRQTAAGELSRAEGSDSHAIALGANRQAWPAGSNLIMVRYNT